MMCNTRYVGGVGMNILFVTGAFAHSDKDQALGGMEWAVYKSALGMEQLGHNVKILAADQMNRMWKYRGIEVISIKAVNIFDCISDFTLIAGIIDRERCLQKKIRWINKRWHIDIVQYTGWYGIGLFRPTEIPAVMRVSSYTNLQFKDDFSKRRTALFSKVERMAVRRMDRVFAPSNIMARSLGADSGRRIQVFETPYMSGDVDEEDSTVGESLENKKYVLFFGRLSLDKGIGTIKTILYDFLKKYPDWYFVFAGGGTVTNGIRIETQLYDSAREMKERVICLGKLNKNQLQPVIKRSQFVVLPSIRDNLPNTCAEAMALGKVVIGTDGSSIEQFITDGYNGFLADINNAKSLLDKIGYVCCLEETDKMNIEKNAINRIRELSVLPYSKRIEKYYHSVINEKKG